MTAMSQVLTRLRTNGFQDAPMQRTRVRPACIHDKLATAERLDLLFARLREVLDLIESVQADIEPGALTDSPSGCWADEEFSYIESTLPSTGPAIIDISVFTGRVLIRASSPVGPERS
jgi:hypothetical protein